MRKLLLVAAIALVCSSMALATNTDELALVSTGATTIVVLDTSIGGNSITYSDADFNGWDIEFTAGVSTSPNTEIPALDLTSLTATCGGLDVKTCAANPLEIWYSDTGFTTAVNGLTTFYSATVEGGGSTSQIAYGDPTDTIFGTTVTIGTVGPLASPGGSGTATLTGSYGPSPYSLSLEQVFTDTGKGAVTFSVDGSLSDVPEPTSIVLFGTILSLGGFAFRRKLKKNS